MDYAVPLPNRHDIDNANAYLYAALDIAQGMLNCGAEVGRVEDSMQRLCWAYGAERVEVFTLNSTIIVTIYGRRFGAVTQTRRIHGGRTDLHQLELFNELCREVCHDHLSPEQIEQRLERIKNVPYYSPAAQTAIYALISGCFSMFFGGSWRDALAAAVIGAILRWATAILEPILSNKFMSAFALACFGGLLARLFALLPVGISLEKTGIGNIMLLIPGIPLTNAIRDMFVGDTISGLSRLLETLLLSVVIAFGFVLMAGIL